MSQSEQKPQFDLAGQVIGLAMKVHTTLGPGFLEEVYRRALAIELDKSATSYQQEFPLPVYYEDTAVGMYRADLFIKAELIVEVKAVQTLVIAHEVQLVNYLTAARIESGLLLNFGAGKLEFKRKYRHRPSN